ncbi:MAG: TonB-dependent receptor [Chloroherpetonaceae bacterium]|nr:TonB-dependent receptor [Chloroherpetonaceae bacterium]
MQFICDCIYVNRIVAQVKTDSLTGSLRGQVFESISKEPIAGVLVYLLDVEKKANPTTLSTTVTDEKGRFNISIRSIQSPSPHQFELRFSRIGYKMLVMPLGSIPETDLRVSLQTADIQYEEMQVQSERILGSGLSTQSSEVLKLEELDRHRGQTFGEMISEVTGVTILQTGPSISKPVIRGLHSQRIVIMNDGIRQEGQQWGAEHAPEIDPFAAGRIEVLKGGRSVEYGADAIGGVIRVEPKPFETQHGLSGEVRVNSFSNNLQGALSAEISGDFKMFGFSNDDLRWRFQASIRQAGNSETPDYIIRNSGFRETDVAVFFGNIANDQTLAWRFHYSRFMTELGIYRGAHIGNLTDLQRAIERGSIFDSSATFTYDIISPRQEISHDRASIAFSIPSLIGNWELSTGAQLNIRKEFDAFTFGGISGTIPALKMQLFTATSDAKLTQLPDQNFFGSWLKNTIGRLGVSTVFQMNVRGESRQRLIPDFISFTIGLFVTEEIQLSESSTINFGGRFDYRIQEAAVFNRSSRISTDVTRDFQAATFSLGYKQKVWESFYLSGNIASAWRPPSINELYSDGVHHGTAIYERGNPTLLVEQSNSIEFGAEIESSDVKIEISTYYNRFSNFIFQEPTGIVLTLRGAFPATAYSQSDAAIYGAEFSLRAQLNTWASLESKVAIVRGDNLTRNEPLILIPSDRASVSLHFDLPDVWGLSENFIQLGIEGVRRQNRIPAPLISQENITQSSLSEADYRELMIRLTESPAGYALLNFEMGTKIKFDGKNFFTLSLSVQNLTNQRYREYLSRFRYYIDNPGRNFVLRAQIPFGSSS